MDIKTQIEDRLESLKKCKLSWSEIISIAKKQKYKNISESDCYHLEGNIELIDGELEFLESLDLSDYVKKEDAEKYLDDHNPLFSTGDFIKWLNNMSEYGVYKRF